METAQHKFHSKMADRIELVPLDDLVPYAKNARTHSREQVDQIAASINEFGFNNPILVDSQKGIIAGHGRFMAATQLGLDRVPVVKLDHLTDAQKRAYIIADNKLALNAGWDDELLADELLALKDDGFDLDVIGFSDDELADLLPDAPEGGGGNTNEDEVPDVQENIHGVKRGDIFQLGNHRLMCGDSTNKDDVDRLMQGEKADMVFTDPPYGIEYDDVTRTKWDSEQTRTSKAKANNFGQIKNDNIPVELFVSKILEFFGYSKRIFIWGVLNGNGNVPKGSFIVWDRKNENQTKCPFGDFDICWSKNVGWKMLRHLWGGFISKEKGEQRWHPTQKPVSLVIDFFERWGKDKDLVIDLFLGSGSTLIACEKTNRKCYGMEIDPHYCSVIIERWQNFTGKKATKL